MSKCGRDWRRRQREERREAWRERRYDDQGQPFDAREERDGNERWHRRRNRERGPFRRYPERGIAAGVIAGLARWLGWSTWAVRGPSIALLVMNPPLFIAAYLTLWAVMDREIIFGWIQSLFPRLPDAVPATRVEDVRARLRQIEERAARLEERVTNEAFALNRRFRQKFDES
jgi:phage shock protein PspC (stress-responsive transcriptional regulator)